MVKLGGKARLKQSIRRFSRSLVLPGFIIEIDSLISYLVQEVCRLLICDNFPYGIWRGPGVVVCATFSDLTFITTCGQPTSYRWPLSVLWLSSQFTPENTFLSILESSKIVGMCNKEKYSINWKSFFIIFRCWPGPGTLRWWGPSEGRILQGFGQKITL